MLSIAMKAKEGAKASVVTSLLNDHQRNYFWIHNNFKYAEPLSVQSFKEMVQELAQTDFLRERLDVLVHYEALRKEKVKKILRHVPFTRAEKEILSWSSFLAWWQDQRKKANLIGDYWMDQCIRQLVHKHGYAHIELLHADVNEILELQKGKKISKMLLRKRMQSSLHYVCASGDVGIITGQEAVLVKKRLLPPQKKYASQVRGTAGSMGIAQGKVNIIMNPRNASMNKGDVLVTGMTRPEFLPLMKKAAAIITDEGGITSHAAIIARELGIPCIVGCKTATKILKQGQEVLVNANHGVVKLV